MRSKAKVTRLMFQVSFPKKQWQVKVWGEPLSAPAERGVEERLSRWVCA